MKKGQEDEVSEVGRVVLLLCCRLSGEPELHPKCDGKPSVVSKQVCEDGTVTLVDQETLWGGGCLFCHHGHRNHRPTVCPTCTGFDFTETWQAGLGTAMVCDLFNVDHQAPIPSIVLGAGETAVKEKNPV